VVVAVQELVRLVQVVRMLVQVRWAVLVVRQPRIVVVVVVVLVLMLVLWVVTAAQGK